MSSNISDICLIQFCRIIFAFNNMQCGIIRFIINSVIVKRNQHSLIDCIRKRKFIRYIVITNFVNIFSIHSLRCRSKTKQKFGFEIFCYFTIWIIDRMVKFINYNVVKIIFCKILFIQIFRFSKRHDGSKNYGLIRTFICSSKETIII